MFFILEFRIFALEFGAVGMVCQCLKHAADGKTETRDSFRDPLTPAFPTHAHLTLNSRFF